MSKCCIFAIYPHTLLCFLACSRFTADEDSLVDFISSRLTGGFLVLRSANLLYIALGYLCLILSGQPSQPLFMKYYAFLRS